LISGELPKQLTTVEISPTPGTQTVAQVILSPSPTLVEIGLPSPTPFITPTPYVGVFIGQPTVISPDGSVSLPPTIEAVVAVPANPANVVGTPLFIPTLNGTDCPFTIDPTLSVAQTLGCPLEAANQPTLIMQRFERGRMFWRDTRQIIVISDTGQFWRVADSWDESQPSDDPSLTPPAGLNQPVRGFGLVWRNDSNVQSALGWAVGPEFPLASTWQEFQNGSAFVGDSNQVYRIPARTAGQLSP
jgi:hypothetical protein